MTRRPAPPSAPFRAAEHLRTDGEIALYIEEMLADGDARAMSVALRTVADALGGMRALAERAGVSRETLYRTLSGKGTPRVDTVTTVLAAFGLRLSVRRAGKGRTRQAVTRSARERRSALKQSSGKLGDEVRSRRMSRARRR